MFHRAFLNGVFLLRLDPSIVYRREHVLELNVVVQLDHQVRDSAAQVAGTAAAAL